MQRLCPQPVAAMAPPLHRVRIGAFDGEDLVGWSHSWREPGGQLYVGSSAVLPPYRPQGVCTRLLAARIAGLQAIAHAPCAPRGSEDS